MILGWKHFLTVVAPISGRLASGFGSHPLLRGASRE
jgi:hypothetical protein